MAAAARVLEKQAQILAVSLGEMNHRPVLRKGFGLKVVMTSKLFSLDHCTFLVQAHNYGSRVRAS